MGRIEIGIAHHTSLRRGTYSDSWGTPEDLLLELPPIDLDLASSAEHNLRVWAKRFFADCPDSPEVAKGEFVWCNPPGPGTEVKRFWGIWLRCLFQGARGAFLIYNIDHWRQLPATGLAFDVVVLRKRLRFVGAKSSANFASVLVCSGFRPPELGHIVRW